MSDFGFKRAEEQSEGSVGKRNFECRLPAAGRDCGLRKKSIADFGLRTSDLNDRIWVKKNSKNEQNYLR